ncbi:MFS family permease [Actinoplanes lutulentus]|uniref:Putative MFS family arabinose efflux permease n=1 Tax=Actinoplanes lutulentus TaxID=1287878 RepID=A0A327ZEL5_9ACTN|nr:MFS transporter [Actinoplanes lutulentus]MBB2941883.1 MFS family permease [Actinoplanes lutulentus]RAK39800.1 putative MFS family arabinose efflux permease [Actinoplanes lutulentus]
MSTLIQTLLPARLGTGFRWLLASSWTTNLGDGIAVAAGPLLVASLTRDPFLISLAALLTWAPPLICGLFAGVLSDRHDRRRIILLANAVRLLVLAAMVALLATDHLTVQGALIGFGLIATAEVFADNTTGTLTPMLVHRDDLSLANARLQTGFITLNQLAGPPIGAAVFAAGRAWPLVAEAVLVIAGMFLVARVVLPPHGRAPSDPGSASVWRDIAEGFRWVLHHPPVRTLCLTILIFNLTFGAAWSVLVLYASVQLGLGAIGFGLITTVSAVGGILGTGLYGWLTARISLGNLMRIGLTIETLVHLALAATTSPWVAMPVFFIFGAHAFVWGTTSTTVRQRAVPSHLQGRVGSVNTICVYGGLVIGSAFGGTIATHYGIAAPFWVAFAGSALFLILLWPQMTRIAHTPH